MKKPSDQYWDELRDKLIGLGENSFRKSYYPELQQRLQDLENSYQALEALAEELEESQQNLIELNAELSSSQERLEQALWGARAGLWDWHGPTEEVTINHRYREICGYDSDVIRHHISEWEKSVHAQDWPEVQARLHSHLEGRTPYFEAEYRIKNKNGEWIWLLDSGRVVDRDENGQFTRMVGIVQEISERKQVEQALESSKAFYQGIFNGTSNPVFLMDIDTFDILDANPAAQKTFEYNLDELRQMSSSVLNSILFGESRLLAEQVQAILCKGSSTVKGSGKKKNGEIFPVMITCTIIPVEEQQVIMAVVNDLSEEILYQQEREKVARYEAQALKMTTLSIMSAGVVHEISQPLNAIKVLADGMLFWQEIGRDMDHSKALDTFCKISVQAERINEIIRHMRNLANAGEDRTHSPFDLNNALSGTMQMLGRQLSAHGIIIDLELDQNLPSILGQEERMEEVIINLVVNAMHALDEHQHPDKRIVCRTRRNKDRVVLEVADNGPGIAAGLDRQIWEPFFSTRKGGKGMGLGLVIVQSIVSSLGGSINHYMNEWGGATFHLELLALDQGNP